MGAVRYLFLLLSEEVKFSEIIANVNLTPEQIYNCDEIGLNYKMLPSRTLASGAEKTAPGFKTVKPKVTLLVCSNASGSHKLPLVLIGQSSKPRAFKNLSLRSFPVKYRSQKNSWMTCDIFSEWVPKEFVLEEKRFLKKMKLPQKAVLLLDNAPSHPTESELVKEELFEGLELFSCLRIWLL